MTDNFRPIVEEMDDKQFDDLLLELHAASEEIERAKDGNFGSKQYLQERFDIISRILEFDD